MTQNAIEISGLSKTYAASGRSEAKHALNGIDLNIPRGMIFGLLGPNGAGKSTIINILAGLVNKTSGQVRIWGFDQDVNPRQSRASIGVMPQEPNLDPFFTPRQSLEVQAGLYGVPAAQRKTDEILDLIGLTDKAGAYAIQGIGSFMIPKIEGSYTNVVGLPLCEVIAALEERGDLVRIKAEIDPHLEMTEIADRTLRAGGPALLFENPKGYNTPVLANLFGTEQRVALGMGAESLTAQREIGEIICDFVASYTTLGKAGSA